MEIVTGGSITGQADPWDWSKDGDGGLGGAIKAVVGFVGDAISVVRGALGLQDDLAPENIGYDLGDAAWVDSRSTNTDVYTIFNSDGSTTEVYDIGRDGTPDYAITAYNNGGVGVDSDGDGGVDGWSPGNLPSSGGY